MKKIVLIFLAACAIAFNTHGQNEISGHEYVDLGLNVKWATCNIGAKAPHEYGDYYAWGETTTKSSYIDYNSKTYGKNFEDISGDQNHDAARANWGKTWRIPTKAEMEELESKCTWTWTSQSGTNGYKVTGPNGNSIFLPAAGFRNGNLKHKVGDNGFYSTSSLHYCNKDGAYTLIFKNNGYSVYWYLRHVGLTIRPVSD